MTYVISEDGSLVNLDRFDEVVLNGNATPTGPTRWIEAVRYTGGKKRKDGLQASVHSCPLFFCRDEQEVWDALARFDAGLRSGVRVIDPALRKDRPDAD